MAAAMTPALRTCLASRRPKIIPWTDSHPAVADRGRKCAAVLVGLITEAAR